MIGEPPSLDLHWTTAVITQQITWHIYETLFTYDRNFEAIPLLAESHTVTDGRPSSARPALDSITVVAISNCFISVILSETRLAIEVGSHRRSAQA